MTIAISGASGGLGSSVIRHLSNKGFPAPSIRALVRDAAKGRELAALGVDVRVADYDDRAALQKALAGVDRFLLVSGNDFARRREQHRNAVDAAKEAGVRLLAYTSISQADRSTHPLAPDHRATEEYIWASGLAWVVLRNNWYTENYGGDLGAAKASGMLAAAVHDGKVASAPRDEYAEAAATALLAPEPSRVYELAGPAWTYAELAEAMGRALGREVRFRSVTVEEKSAMMVAAGLPPPLADTLAGWDRAVDQGSLSFTGPDLGTLLGRAPSSLDAQMARLAQGI